MIGHVLAAVRADGARSGSSRWSATSASRSARTSSAGARRGARGPGDPGRHRARGAGRRRGLARPSAGGTVVVVATGDTPLLRGREPARVRRGARGRPARGEHPVAASCADPFGYGRVVRNDEGDVVAIVEEKDATAEQREIARDQLRDPRLRRRRSCVEALPRIGNDNAKGEYYLTDTVRLARDDGLTVGAYAIDDVMQTEGANDRAQLAALGRELNRRIVTRVDAGRRHGDGPGDHLGRRRRRARARRHDPARHPAARRDRGRPRTP